MEDSKYDAKLVPHPFGFRNMGATCYFNALLQSIISCPAFAHAILENREKEEYKVNAVVQDMLALYDASDADPSVLREIAPKVWKSVFAKASLRKDNVKFTRGQECAREGFHLFLESLDGLNELQRLFMHRYQTLIYCADCDEWVVNVECEYTMFEVQPNLMSPQLPRFKNIDVNYEKSRPLDQFIKKQNSYVDSAFKCPRCKKADERFQITRLLMIPEILVVLSKKYDGRGQRKSREVTNFPETMYFDGKRTREDQEPTPLIYKAVSRIEHMGSMVGGHYNCHSVRKDGKWYRLDDARVDPGTFEPSPDTYLVFYHIQ